MEGQSLQRLKKVSGEEIQRRMGQIHMLSTTNSEQYTVMRDQETAEHYLHYAYVHRSVSGGMAEEEYHQLMPIDSDDVIALVLGEQPYAYPDHWQRAFLRNGPEDNYVWFDPSFAEQMEDDEQIGRGIMEKLQAFKQTGEFDDAALERLFADLKSMDDEKPE